MAVRMVDSAICCWGFAVPTRFEDMLTEEWGAEYVKEVAFYADVVERWVAEGQALADRPDVVRVERPLPRMRLRRCAAARRLGWSHASVSAERAVCLSCFAKLLWPPSQFLFLGRLLGCESATELLAS